MVIHTYRKTYSFKLLQILVMLIFWVGISYGKELNTSLPKGVKLSLTSDKAYYVRGDQVRFLLVVHNNSDSTHKIVKPDPANVSFTIIGPGSDTLKLQATGTPVSEVIYLRPHSSIALDLGGFLITKLSKEGKLTGNYKVNVLVKEMSIGHSKMSELLVSDILSIQDYPLSIELLPASSSYLLGDKIVLDIRIKNNGNDKIKLFNLFHPYEDYFELIINQKKSQTGGFVKKEEIPKARALVSLPQEESWLTLMPGEFIQVPIDISGKKLSAGTYEISVIYGRKILISPSDQKPFYADQVQWPSKPVRIQIK